jgi:hypothetical protein
MTSTALPAVSLITRWFVPSYTLPRVLATTWFIQQVFSLDSSVSGGKWTDSHWKAAKHLVRYIRGTTNLCLIFDGDCGKRIILAIWRGRLVTVRGHALLLNCHPRPTAGPRRALLLSAAGPTLPRRLFPSSATLPTLSVEPSNQAVPPSTYADNHLTTVVSSGMPPSSSVPPRTTPGQSMWPL